MWIRGGLKLRTKQEASRRRIPRLVHPLLTSMNHRIITDNNRYRVQIRQWWGWRTVTEEVTDRDGTFRRLLEFATEEDARKWAESSAGVKWKILG